MVHGNGAATKQTKPLGEGEKFVFYLGLGDISSNTFSAWRRTSFVCLNNVKFVSSCNSTSKQDFQFGCDPNFSFSFSVMFSSWLSFFFWSSLVWFLIGEWVVRRAILCMFQEALTVCFVLSSWCLPLCLGRRYLGLDFEIEMVWRWILV